MENALLIYIIEVYLQKHIQNPVCKISEMVFFMNIIIAVK